MSIECLIQLVCPTCITSGVETFLVENRCHVCEHLFGDDELVDAYNDAITEMQSRIDHLLSHMNYMEKGESNE